MISFRRLSIKYKLAAMLFLIAFIALLFGFGVHVAQDMSSFKQDLVDEAASTARIVGDYCVVDIAFDDRDAARRTLSKLSSDAHVECACLYETNGKLFSSYVRTGASGCPAAPQLAPAVIDEEDISISEPVYYQKQNYGRLVLRISSESLKRKIHSYSVTLIVLSGGLLLLSVLLALRFQKVISRPILNLVETTRAISQNNDFSIRVEKQSEDEIGVLCEEFNGMLSRIEKGTEARDIAERALRESENRYRLLIESSPQAVYLEQDRQIIYANPAALRLYGCHSISDLKGVRLSTLFPNFESGLKRYKSGPLEHVLQRSDGKTVPIEVSFIVTVYQGKTALQVLAWDITESKNLRQSAERVQRLAALGEFSAILAHEIRNSLGAITLNMKTLSERLEIPENYRKTFANMELGTQRIQEVIKGILDFARPAPPSLRKVSLNRVVESSIHTIESELESVKISVVREFDSSDPEVAVDPAQIGQVLVNLLMNARHATAPGGRITVSTRKLNEIVELKIADTGRGIPESDLEKIFDPFFTTTPFGSGLGLAFVSRILEQHQTPIFVESEVNVGTVFTIQFSTSDVK